MQKIDFWTFFGKNHEKRENRLFLSTDGLKNGQKTPPTSCPYMNFLLLKSSSLHSVVGHFFCTKNILYVKNGHFKNVQNQYFSSNV